MHHTKPIVVVTGNKNKLKEIIAIAGDLELTSQEINLDEIQSLDLQAIVTHKLTQAYELTHKPVVVEDVSAELSALGGLPGPFVKFFIQKMGPSALFALSESGKPDPDDPDSTNHAVTIRCLAGYFDGKKMLFGEGVVKGEVVSPRGTHGFGFDSTIVPKGHHKTTAEMDPDEKNQISHRALAMRNLFAQIELLADKK
jgi:non-canonical purine NTP pyrophosphatase (RdgB/HAM1 family)